MKDSFNEDLESVLYQFLKYDMTILLGGFNVKLGRERPYFQTNNQE